MVRAFLSGIPASGPEECINIREWTGDMMLAQRVSKLEQSLTLAITGKAKAMKAKGEKVILFASGEPDCDTPENIKEAGIKAIKDGFTKYTATSGIDELKEQICLKFKNENNIDYEKSEVIVTCGGKQAIYNVIQAMINEGDEVIVPTPYWVSYLEQIKMAGGKPVLIPLKAQGLDVEELERAVTARTRLLIINSPNNPTGSIITRDVLEKIAELAVKHNFYVLSDEVYEHFIYDGHKHASIASFDSSIKALTITINAFSKTYSMTGWRVGYCAARQEIIKMMGMIQDHSTSNVCSIAQKAAVEALKGPQDSVKAMVHEFNSRRIYMVERLSAIPGVECPKPPGAFYTFPRVSSLYRGGIKNSMDFAGKLLEDQKVALIPGVAFGHDDHIRLTYASSMDDIKEGMDRIEAFVGSLKK